MFLVGSYDSCYDFTFYVSFSPSRSYARSRFWQPCLWVMEGMWCNATCVILMLEACMVCWIYLIIVCKEITMIMWKVISLLFEASVVKYHNKWNIRHIIHFQQGRDCIIFWIESGMILQISIKSILSYKNWRLLSSIELATCSREFWIDSSKIVSIYSESFSRSIKEFLFPPTIALFQSKKLLNYIINWFRDIIWDELFRLLQLT